MKNKFTTLLILAALVSGIYIFLTTLLTNFLSGPRLKAILIKPVEKALARNVEIGTIKVSIFKGINFTNLVIKDQNPEETFASIDSFNLHYELLPLLQGKLVIKSVQVNNPKLNIVKNKRGILNLANIGKPVKGQKVEDDPSQEYVDPLPLALTFESVSVSKGTLTFTDLTGELPRIDANGDAALSISLGKDLASTSISGTTTILANGIYKDQKPVLMLDGRFTQKAFSFQGNISMGFEKLIFNGIVDNYASRPEIKLNVNSSRLNLDNITTLINSQKTTGKKKPAETAPPIPTLTEAAEISEPVTGEVNQAPADAIPALAPETGQAALPTPPTVEPVQPAAQETLEVEGVAAQSSSPAGKEPAAKTQNFSCLGDITISELISTKFKARNIKVYYSLNNHVVTLKNFSGEIFGGNIIGNVILDLKPQEPIFTGDLKAKGIALSELLEKLGKPTENLSGALTTSLTFNGTGLEWPTLQNTLSGEGDYLLADGGIKSPISSALAALLEIPEVENLRFKDLTGSLKIVNGDVQLTASLTSSQFDLKGEGRIGLNGNLDLPLTLLLSQENSLKLAEKSAYSNYLADDQGRISLHVLLQGSTNEPKLRFDEKESVNRVQKIVVKKAEEKLGEAIKKELGVSPEQGDIVKGLSEKFLNEMFKK
ncbi:MAG: YdbH domain-containing protein [Proteobacteria bacterium]|nr:YdbH domain-containing protein [Pseudomonadota bacterium]MBU1737636.1 YdbH domain-containing protein [Pseudomonadota bacterium]